MSGKKKKHEEEENQERWLLTYADMITLLVAFFMMMYSMSIINLEKFKAAAIGIRSGFNGLALGKKPSGESMVEKGGVSKPAVELEASMLPAKPRTHISPKQDMAKKPVIDDMPKPSSAQLHAERVSQLSKNFKQSLIGVTKGESAKITQQENGVAIELVGDLIFFPKESAQLSEEAKKILLVVTSVLSTMANEVSVEGYTSHFSQTENAPFRNSWELSTARAMAVVNYFMESKKVDPARVSVTGYGQYRPMEKKQHSTVEGGEADDRVRIFVYQN